MTANASAPTLLAPVLHEAEVRAGTRTRRVLVAALGLSLALHLALTLWPADLSMSPETTPLTATLTELPPPPKPSATAPAPPHAKPRPKRASPVAAPQPAPVDMPQESVTAEAKGAPEVAQEAPPEAISAAAVAAEAEVIAGAATGIKTLPPRVDLTYKVYYGTLGFLIGDATYRFEHANNRYRISTVGEARGLAALVLRGQGKLESTGLITDDGLLPQSLRIERGGPDRVEMAIFDWEAGIVTMHENKTAPLDLPTFDPLSLMWQYYFTPPTTNTVSFAVATPRRVIRYTITREETEKIEWSQGTIEAERWHRRSEDGKTDAYVWLAPSLRFIAVKMRVSNTERGTIEVLLDSIHVDEAAATAATTAPATATSTAAATASHDDPAPERARDAAAGTARPGIPLLDNVQPSATFPTMTGQ